MYSKIQLYGLLEIYLIFHTNIIPLTLDAHVIIDRNMHTIWFEYLALSVYLLSPVLGKYTKLEMQSACSQLVFIPSNFISPSTSCR